MPLLLLPNLLDEELDHTDFFPSSLDAVVPTLDGLIAESPKGGRRFLKRFTYPEGKTFREIPILLLNEHSTDDALEELLIPLKRGEKWGLISDAGLPVLADPGARLVKRLHELKITAIAFTGPSSIVYALMLSGLSAQSFSFHGYLPKKPEELRHKLKKLEKEGQTQVFIEAPYRTSKLLQFLLETLDGDTVLCLAWNLTLPAQGVRTQTVREWRKKPLPELHKVPAVFLFESYAKKKKTHFIR